MRVSANSVTHELERQLRERRSYRAGGDITPDNLGDFLLHRAKDSAEVRWAVIRVLFALPVPRQRIGRLTDRVLLNALRITQWMLAMYRCRGTPEHEKWQRAQQQLLHLLLQQVPRQPSSAKQTLQTVTDIDAEIWDVALREIESWRANVIFVGQSRIQRRGRRLDNHNERQLAAVLLLSACGETKDHARELLSKELRPGDPDSRDVGSLKSFEYRYRRMYVKGRSDAIPTERLVERWLHVVGDPLLLMELGEPSATLLGRLRQLRFLLPEVPAMVSFNDTTASECTEE